MIAFFATSSFQVSDKDVDGQVEICTESFLENEVEGKSVARDTLNAKDFSVFSGYIFENGTRFKSGSDGKIRTSRYFVTAVSVKEKYCVIATSLFDLLSNEKALTSIFSTKNADAVVMDITPTEFPKGNRKCVLSVTRCDTKETVEFYLPDDALADQLIARFK